MKPSSNQDIPFLLTNLHLLHQFRSLEETALLHSAHPLSDLLDVWQKHPEKLQKPSTKDFAIISHFLVVLLNRKRHQEEFKHCFVPQSMAENREFKKILKIALEEYSEEETLLFPSEIFKMKSGYEASNPLQALRLLRMLSDALVFKILEQNHTTIPTLPLTRKEVKEGEIAFILNEPAQENIDPKLAARAKRVYTALIESEIQKFKAISGLKMREQESWKDCARKLRDEYLSLRKEKKKLNVTRQTQLKSMQSQDGTSAASNMEIASLERIPLIEQTQSMNAKLILAYEDTLKSQHFHLLKRAIETQKMTLLSKQGLDADQESLALEQIVRSFNDKLKTRKMGGLGIVEKIKGELAKAKKKQEHGLQGLRSTREELV